MGSRASRLNGISGRVRRSLRSRGLGIFQFIVEVGAGVYFVEPYDPGRVPVLFVHGIGGNPREFEALTESLDRTRFQPWFYYYPSAASLSEVAAHLAQLVRELRVRHGFERIFVVAHSMGGLVARSFVQQHFERMGNRTVRLFVSISTPWGGHAAAQKGVDRAPVVVRSWVDIAPDSAFLNGLFFEDPDTRAIARALPAHVPYHLIFGFRRARKLLGPSTDTVVTVASELRREAQREAVRIYGLDHDHTGILRSSETANLLNEILKDALR